MRLKSLLITQQSLPRSITCLPSSAASSKRLLWVTSALNTSVARSVIQLKSRSWNPGHLRRNKKQQCIVFLPADSTAGFSFRSAGNIDEQKIFLTVLRAIFTTQQVSGLLPGVQQDRWIIWIKAAIRIRNNISSCNRRKSPSRHENEDTNNGIAYICQPPVKTTRVRRPSQDCVHARQTL